MREVALVTGASLSLALTEETANTGVTVTCLCPGPTRAGFQERAQMGNSRLFQMTSVMSPADAARAGYDAMMAGRALVVPGIANRIGVQAVRFVPRRVAAKIAGALNAEH
jgi:short-subunit dehydrogenase